MVHADGKRMSQEGEIVERFPIVFSEFLDGKVRIWKIPIIENGRGDTMATELHGSIVEAGAEKFITDEAGDTCAPVTGEYGGMFTLLEKLLDRALLKLWCRHHLGDLLTKAAFRLIFGNTKSPENAEFKAFRKAWPKLDRSSITPLKNSFSELREDQVTVMTCCKHPVMKCLRIRTYGQIAVNWPENHLM